MEFSDGMQAVSFALNTGYSIENAFAEAVGELELLYGKESSIVREFRMMVMRPAPSTAKMKFHTPGAVVSASLR